MGKLHLYLVQLQKYFSDGVSAWRPISVFTHTHNVGPAYLLTNDV